MSTGKIIFDKNLKKRITMLKFLSSLASDCKIKTECVIYLLLKSFKDIKRRNKKIFNVIEIMEHLHLIFFIISKIPDFMQLIL